MMKILWLESTKWPIFKVGMMVLLVILELEWDMLLVLLLLFLLLEKEVVVVVDDS